MEPSRILEALPIFPLPRLVLMPGDILPLHIFEPRYRALVAHCRAGDGMLGMATLLPGNDADDQGTPPIHPEIGVGRIVAFHPIGDGRSNIVVQWMARAHLLHETRSTQPFRLVECEIRRDLDDASLSDLRSLVMQLGAYSETAADEANRLVSLSPREMVHELARRMLEDPDERLRYVSLDRVSERALLLEAKLADIVGARPAVGDA